MRANKIIEFTGFPNSGTSTLIRKLKEDLPKRYNITVQVFTTDSLVIPSELPQDSWDRNVWETYAKLQSIVEAYHSSADVVLLDKGLFDAIFNAVSINNQGKATYEQCLGMGKILAQTYDHLHFYPDYLFLIDVSVEESLNRLTLDEATSIYSKRVFLNQYKANFNAVFKSYISDNMAGKFIPVPSFYYDTTNMDEDEIFKIVAKKIKELCF